MDNTTLKLGGQLVVAVVALCTAWDARNKKQRLERQAETQMHHNTPLRAAIESQEGGNILKKFAAITREGDTYKLEIRRDSETGPLEVVDTFTNLDALESYLASKTIFRFGDFIAR